MPPLFARRFDRILFLAAWIPIAALLAAILHAAAGTPWTAAAVLTVPAAALLSALCVAAQFPARALPADRTPLARLVGAHVAGAVVSVAVWLGILRVLVEAAARTGGWSRLRADFPHQAPLVAAFGVLVYLLAVTVHHLVHVAERSRDAERRSLEHALHARESELKLLRAQIDPHFLFNALNSIAGLIHSDPDGAQAACIRLGSFLRSGLELGAHDLVALEKELALARDFLAIERARFGSRLRLKEDIEPGALSTSVPPLILQPLLENAVRHGIAGLVEGGEVSVGAHLIGPRLRLTVENDRDLEAASRRGAGLGLANVRRRLAALYGDAAILALHDSERRFVVELTMPAETAGAAAGVVDAPVDAEPRGAGGVPRTPSAEATS